MTLAANSYGTVVNVATLASSWSRDGVFYNPDPLYNDPGTNPTYSQVEIWMDQVSAMLNASLAQFGFIIPVTQADCVLALGAYVEQVTADLCAYKNSSGRFFTDKILEAGVTPMTAIRKDVKGWVEETADGLEALGAERTKKTTLPIEAGVMSVDIADHDETIIYV